MKVAIFKNYEDPNVSYAEVADWLSYIGCEVVYFSGKEFFEGGTDWKSELSNDGTQHSICYEDINSLWFRGMLRYREYTKKIINGIESTNDNISELKIRTIYELRKITYQIYDAFSNTFQVPNIKAIKIDKFEVLKIAKQAGLQIPSSIITNNKTDLVEFRKKHGKIITKSLYETVYFEEVENIFFYKTQIIEKSDLEHVPKHFFPSLFQEYIEKDIELRIFYLDGEMYPMAIFSQLDGQTSVDFRNYNDENPNRKVPYKLPESVQSRLQELMKHLDLNTGSIDLIKTPEGRYIFLEVNPTGQFGFNSKPCNYYLEEKIARFLKDKGQSN